MELNHKFLESALAQEGVYQKNHTIGSWIARQRERVEVMIETVPLAELDQWSYDKISGQVVHKTGAFFSIPGIEVETTWNGGQRWTQPIIKQAEVGYLGVLVKEFDGVPHFLMQAKIEPGNINKVQLSPTLQATRSNFMRAHEGKAPIFLDLFRDASPNDILIDQLQSEQGARFLKKRNRNIVVQLRDHIEIPEHFTWLTLGQIKALMIQDNVVNMDSRTVISGIPFGTFRRASSDVISFLASHEGRETRSKHILRSLLCPDGAQNSEYQIRSFLTNLKANHDLTVREIPLKDLEEWNVTDESIERDDKRFFKVIGTKVQIENREVSSWMQPMVQPSQEGLCAFVGKIINGVLHFAVQAKLECGNFDIVELAPTVQCLTGNYRHANQKPPFLDYVINASSEQIWIDSMQSEEGGRFYREQNRNLVVIGDECLPVELPPNFIWMTLNQLQTFIQFNNIFNIQARSLFAALTFGE